LLAPARQRHLSKRKLYVVDDNLRGNADEVFVMDLGGFAPYLMVVEIVLAIVLTVLVLLQAKGSDLGGFMGGDASSGYRTRRGIDATMHKATIGFGVVFFISTLLTFIAMGQM
jgi:preprotein translocase subunit SecG